MTKTAIAVGVACALLRARAMAETGFYAGMGVGRVTMEDSFAGIPIKGDGTGFKLFGGYRINDYFAAEFAYVDAGNPEDTVFGFTVDSDASAVQASMIGTLPVGERFGFFLRGSLLAWEATNTATDGFTVLTEETDGNDFAYGIGASFKIAGNFSLRAEFEGADLNGTDLQLLSLSGLFSF